MSKHHLSKHNINLSEDVLLLIFEALPRSSLRTVSQTSKAFHGLAISVLYRSVNFSAKPVTDKHRVSGRIIDALHVRQWRFTQQILRKPSYGKMVRSFTWTMGLEGQTRLAFLIGEHWDEEAIYTMFNYLISATHISINTRRWSPSIIPHFPALSPSATHVRLNGKFTYAFVSSILHNPAATPLFSLILDNVVECGLIQDPVTKHPMIVTRCGNAVEDSERLSQVPENWSPGSLPLQVRPSCMRRLLTPLLLRRSRQLRYLVLLKQGHQHLDQIFPSAKYTFDRDVYDEWASFISAVRPRELLIGHLRDVKWPYNGKPYVRGCMTLEPEPIRWPVIAPMDEYLRDIVVPVLKRGWAGLERIEIKGANKMALEGLEPRGNLSGVNVVIDEEMDSAWTATVGLR